VRPLTARDMLSIWERGARAHAVDQALVILATACPELSLDELLDLPLQELDARLLALRTATFGPAWEAWGECPSCAERVEFRVPAEQIASRGRTDVESPMVLVANDIDLVLRPPTSRDLRAAAACASVQQARRTLLLRCIVSAEKGGAPVSPDELPADVLLAIAQHFSRLDDNGEVVLDVVCSRCSHAWQLLFDAGSYFWAELCAEARRLFHEVHALAHAYGWREMDILAMSPRRREAYLTIVGA
jgi:hypothetical protein